MKAALLLVGTLLGVVGGCGDDASGRDEFITQVCAEFADCCRAAGRPSDGKQCRALYGAVTPSSGYDEAAGQACLDEIRAQPDKCNSASMSTPSCDRVFSGGGGNSKPGGPCETNGDCAPSDAGEIECVTHYSDGASFSQCQERLLGKEGSSPCLGTVEGNSTSSFGSGDETPASGYLCHIADNLACDSETGACQTLPGVGEPCGGGFYRCAPASYCAFADNTCQPRLALGAACTQNDECAEGTYCSGTCVAQTAVGEACTTGSECASRSCSNGKCAPENDFGLAFLCGSN